MDYNEMLNELRPLVVNRAYATSQSGQNEIRNVVKRYLDANFSKNQLCNSNINVNLIFGGTTINDINSQSQSELQIQRQ